MEIVSSLGVYEDSKKFIGGRRTGNTTRMVDWVVQKLFEGHKVVCEDHFELGHHRKANLSLWGQVLDRLRREHPNVLDKVKAIQADPFCKGGCTIWLDLDM